MLTTAHKGDLGSSHILVVADITALVFQGDNAVKGRQVGGGKSHRVRVLATILGLACAMAPWARAGISGKGTADVDGIVVDAIRSGISAGLRE